MRETTKRRVVNFSFYKTSCMNVNVWSKISSKHELDKQCMGIKKNKLFGVGFSNSISPTNMNVIEVSQSRNNQEYQPKGSNTPGFPRMWKNECYKQDICSSTRKQTERANKTKVTPQFCQQSPSREYLNSAIPPTPLPPSSIAECHPKGQPASP